MTTPAMAICMCVMGCALGPSKVDYMELLFMDANTQRYTILNRRYGERKQVTIYHRDILLRIDLVNPHTKEYIER